MFHITAITHRKDPIYLTTIVGKPPQEDYYLGKASERIFLPLLRTQLPEVVDMNMPLEGVFHNCVIVSIDKRYPMQARRMMSWFWGAGQMSFVKIIVVVDADMDVQDEQKILELLLNNIDLERDLFFSEGILDVLNHASDHALYGSKLGIDATRKIKGEPVTEVSSPETATLGPDLATKVQQKYPEVKNCMVLKSASRLPILGVALNKEGPHQGQQFIKTFMADSDWNAVGVLVVLESHVDLENPSEVLWKLFNNLDPRRDIQISNKRVGIDVTRKLAEEGYQQNWPEEIVMSQAIKDQVDAKWDRMFNPKPS